MAPDAILFDGGDFVRFPTGGHLSFARQMMHAFGHRLALVGISTDDGPVGCWTDREIGDVRYRFFSMGRRHITNQKPVVPARITGYLQLRRYRDRILSLGVRSVFVQSPQTLFAIQDWGWDSICYCCAGLTNPLVSPRYVWGRLLAGPFQRKWVEALTHVDLILAAADARTIKSFAAESRGRLSEDRIISFPTRVDTSLFCPDIGEGDHEARQKGIGPTIVACGRLNRVKGWELILESVARVVCTLPHTRLILIGDGEDRVMVERHAAKLGLSSRLTVTGFVCPRDVAKYLNMADVCAVGSHYEGWSVAMLEALACGKPIVSTDVSGAMDLICEGRNGFIVKDRDPTHFADALLRALTLKGACAISRAIAEKYALNHLARDLGRLWPPLSENYDGSARTLQLT